MTAPCTMLPSLPLLSSHPHKWNPTGIWRLIPPSSHSNPYTGAPTYKAGAQTEIRFRPGQTVLSKEAKDALDQMAAQLKNQRGYIIEVQGFSSGQGHAAITNSRKMADSVVRY